MERLRKIVKGRAYKRMKFNQRFTNIIQGLKKKGPNWAAGRKDLIKAEIDKAKERKK